MKINVYDIVANNKCISTENCEILNNIVIKHIKEDNEINISFEDIDVITPCFLRESIGKLYILNKDYWSVLDKNITFSNLNKDDDKLLKRIILSSKTEIFNKIIKD